MCSKIPQKKLILSLLMYVFKKGMIFLSKNDNRFAEIINELPEGFGFLIRVKHTKLKVAIIKSDHILKPLSLTENCNLTLTFNGLCSAFLVFCGIMPQHIAFAEHKISIKGNIGDALVVTQAINKLQSVIFPDIIVKKLIKEFDKSTLRDKYMFLKFYIYGLIL